MRTSKIAALCDFDWLDRQFDLNTLSPGAVDTLHTSAGFLCDMPLVAELGFNREDVDDLTENTVGCDRLFGERRVSAEPNGTDFADGGFVASDAPAIASTPAF